MGMRWMAELKRLRIVITGLFLLVCLIQLIFNINKGYLLIPPPNLDEPLTWQTFQSQIQPITIDHPDDWMAADLFQGNHGDKEVIAYIDPTSFDYPYVTIAYREMDNATLKEVASWGKSRIKTTAPSFASDPLIAIDIQGQDALQRAYSYKDWRDVKISCSHVYLLNRNDAYTVEMCVNEPNNSEQLQSVFEQMVQSIVLN